MQPLTFTCLLAGLLIVIVVCGHRSEGSLEQLPQRDLQRPGLPGERGGRTLVCQHASKRKTSPGLRLHNPSSPWNQTPQLPSIPAGEKIGLVKFEASLGGREPPVLMPCHYSAVEERVMPLKGEEHAYTVR